MRRNQTSLNVLHVICFSQLQVLLSSREREIASLRRQLDQSQEELSSVSRDREVALRENRRLQDDLATMTRENQVHIRTTRPLSRSIFLCFLHLNFLDDKSELT